MFFKVFFVFMFCCFYFVFYVFMSLCFYVFSVSSVFFIFLKKI